MVKLIYDKTNINPNKLHDLLGDVGEEYYLTHNEIEVILLFPSLHEIKTDILENDIVVDNAINYEKHIEVDEITINEEGIESIKKIIQKNVFDFNALKSNIDSAVATHDNTPYAIPDPNLTLQEQVDLLTKLVLEMGGVIDA